MRGGVGVQRPSCALGAASGLLNSGGDAEIRTPGWRPRGNGVAPRRLPCDVAAVLGYSLVAAAACLWGCWSLFLRPTGLSGGKVSLILFAVMSVPALLSKRPLWRERRAGTALLLLGLGDAGTAILYFEAIRRGPVAVAVLTHYLAPLLVALAAPLVLGELPSRRARIAAPLSLVGLALLVGAPPGGVPVWTAVLGTGSAIFYGANVLSSKAAARAYSPLEITSLHAPVSGAAVLVALGTASFPPPPGLPLWLSAAGAFLCGLCGSVLFNQGLRRIPAQAASALTYLEPVIAAVVGALAFGEELGALGVLGAVAIVASGAWVALEPPTRARIDTPP